MEKLTLGEKLVTLRREHGYTQQQLAEKLNYSDKVISKWERNESLPDVMALMALAKIYDMSLDEIVLDSKTPTMEEAKVTTKDNKHYIIAIIVGASVFMMYLLPYMSFNGGYFSFHGFKMLTTSPNNFSGFLLILAVWGTFLLSLSLLAIGIVGIVKSKLIEDNNKHPKAAFISLMVLIILQLLIQILNIGSMQIGSILIFLITAAYTTYEFISFRKKGLEQADKNK